MAIRGKVWKGTRSYWRNGALAGLAGAVVLLAYTAEVYGYGGSGIWVPYSAVAAPVRALPPLVGFTGMAIAIGTLLHLAVGAAWGLVYAWALRWIDRHKPYDVPRSWLEAVMLGVAFGVGVYVVMELLVGPAIVPGLRTLIPTPYLVAHLLYGLATGLAFTWLSRRARVSIAFAPERAAVREKELQR